MTKKMMTLALCLALYQPAQAISFPDAKVCGLAVRSAVACLLKPSLDPKKSGIMVHNMISSTAFGVFKLLTNRVTHMVLLGAGGALSYFKLYKPLQQYRTEALKMQKEGFVGHYNVDSQVSEFFSAIRAKVLGLQNEINKLNAATDDVKEVPFAVSDADRLGAGSVSSVAVSVVESIASTNAAVVAASAIVGDGSLAEAAAAAVVAVTPAPAYASGLPVVGSPDAELEGRPVSPFAQTDDEAGRKQVQEVQS